MTIAASVAATMRAAMAPMATDAATYRIPATHSVRAAAAPAGATSITFTSLPAGLTAAAAGDSFVIGATTHTVTGPVAASGGTLAAVPVTPALATPVPANTSVVLNRNTDHAITMIPEQVGGRDLAPGVWVGGDYEITTFDLPGGVVPMTGHLILWNGQTLRVQPDSRRDEVGAGWIVQARRA